MISADTSWQRNVNFLRHLSKPACTLLLVALAVNGAFADTPASQVSTQTVGAAQSYPVVPANGEGWFDVGGFCKVVDVGDLSSLSPPADGIPVFVPGPADQWENYRTSAPANASYGGRLTLTTCCRPQTNIATLCAGTANPQPVSREYGRLGETDTVSANCVSTTLGAYTETMTLACTGDDGPDGQATWGEFSDTGIPTGPQCPATPITWEKDTVGPTGNFESAEICTGTLPATTGAGPIGGGSSEGSGTAVQIATAANNYTDGSISVGCPASAIWDYSKLRRGNEGYYKGQCNTGCQATSVNWAVGAYSCQGLTTAGTIGQTVSVYTVDGDPTDNGPLTTGGVATYTCQANGSWSLDPGDTCGPGQCVPESGWTYQQCISDCFLEQYDSCGNRSNVGQCGSCACTPTPGSCSCSTNTDSCGNSCTPTGCSSGPTGSAAPTVTHPACSLCPQYNAPPNSPNYYTDCSCDGDWAACPGGTSGPPYQYSTVTDYDGDGAFQHDVITGVTCTIPAQ